MVSPPEKEAPGFGEVMATLPVPKVRREGAPLFVNPIAEAQAKQPKEKAIRKWRRTRSIAKSIKVASNQKRLGLKVLEEK